jgi:restriction system protein
MTSPPKRRVSLGFPDETRELLEAAALLEGTTITGLLKETVELHAMRWREDPSIQMVLSARAEQVGEARLETQPNHFSGSAVLGPDGSPLRPTDSGFQRIEATVQAVNVELLDRLATDPALLRDLHWRDFEQLIAELFTRDGFSVQLTPSSGDGGVDLYAARRSGLGSLLYVVQCKQWAADRPVGPDVVLALKGAIDRDRASAGVVATTSYFTEGARREQRDLRWRVSLQGASDLRRWLEGRPILDVSGGRTT